MTVSRLSWSEVVDQFVTITNLHMSYPQKANPQDVVVVLTDEQWNAVAFALKITSISIRSQEWPELPEFIHGQLSEALKAVAAANIEVTKAMASGEARALLNRLLGKDPDSE